MAPLRTACYLLLLSLVLGKLAHASEDDHGHDHGEKKDLWEWAGVFDLHGPSEAHYTFVASTTAGGGDAHAGHDHGRLLAGHKASWPDASMAVLLLKTTSGDKAGIEAVEEQAEGLWNVSSATTYSGNIAPGVVTNLLFDSESPALTFSIGQLADGPHVLFAQHFPIEFEGFAGHYLKNHKAEDVEPLAEEPEPAKPADPAYGQAIWASIIVSLIALVGLIIVGPFLYSGKMNVTDQSTFSLVSGMFAAGALLGTAFYFIFPETLNSLRLAYTGDSDSQQAAGLGGSALGGIVAGMLIAQIAVIFGSKPTVYAGDKNSEGVEMADKKAKLEEGTAGKAIAVQEAEFDATKISFCQFSVHSWSPVAWSVIFGDFLHNFADGVAIGVAFKTCDPTFGWVVATGAIAHEISQELADFMVLITRGHMSIGAALLLNFLSGLSCLLGTIIALYAEMNHESIGISLGFSGGVYCWVAIGECMAFAANNAKTVREIIYGFSAFVFGAVALGLVLLSHVHCEAEGVDAHAGHNH